MSVGNLTNRGKLSTLAPSDLTRLPEMQCRAMMDADHVEDLRQAIREGKQLPPIRVWNVIGHGMIITDGWHTHEAHVLEKKRTIRAVLFVGSYLDAAMDAAGANTEHLGLKRTNADKRRAVNAAFDALDEATLTDDWSDRKIADKVSVSDDLVRLIRKDRLPEKAVDSDRPRTGIDGRTYKAPVREIIPENEKVSSVDGGHWGDVALEEYLDADDYCWEQLKNVGVKTTGQFLQRLNDGDRFNLQQGDLKKIRTQAEAIRDGTRAEERKPTPRPSPKSAVPERIENPLAKFLREQVDQILRVGDVTVRMFPKQRNSAWHNAWLKWASEGRKLAIQGLNECN